MEIDLSSETILVTGGVGRIGMSVSTLLLEVGATVVISDINEKKLADFEHQMSVNFKNKIYAIPADITNKTNIVELIGKAFDVAGPITGAVHCAYPTSQGWGEAFDSLEEKFLKQDLGDQLGGVILFSQQILDHFLQHSGGKLVHISSIQGVSAPKFHHYDDTQMNSPIEYSAIKTGVIAITRWLAKKYSNKNIRVNCVSPGGVLDNQPEAFIQEYRRSCSNIGLLDSSQISPSIIFLLSNYAEAINGQNIIVDDGWSL
ncbi:oxidoreductase [Prochlorococcus sp. MIT 1306]|uniref:oxidoreductase n=1 Tax=Prochlorococcus sp. MIT 1306 TaxID=1799667 RepID=UPI0007BB42CF|nr:oxidoreductase [Prochlorococcus sp. MIT 1306]KZR61086.1 2,5-dichloro-2,5-cyclohexadiene-1,4-diol dehydrogenase [Prochlorococcus sp. MIT 1306]